MILTVAFLLASPTWYQGSLEGWYYFQEPSRAFTPEEAQFALELEKKRQQEMLALALIDPTRENVANYIQAQREAHEKSLFFAEQWSDVAANGRLDPAFSKRYFLLLSFKGKEPQSLDAAEIGKSFSSSNHWTFKGLSLDGEMLSNIDCEIDQGLSHQLALEESPCFYAVDLIKNFIVPLGSDINSSAEIEERILERCEL